MREVHAFEGISLIAVDHSPGASTKPTHARLHEVHTRTPKTSIATNVMVLESVAESIAAVLV